MARSYRVLTPMTRALLAWIAAPYATEVPFPLSQAAVAMPRHIREAMDNPDMPDMIRDAIKNAPSDELANFVLDSWKRSKVRRTKTDDPSICF